jgi:hypothetical protein
MHVSLIPQLEEVVKRAQVLVIFLSASDRQDTPRPASSVVLVQLEEGSYEA